MKVDSKQASTFEFTQQSLQPTLSQTGLDWARFNVPLDTF